MDKKKNIRNWLWLVGGLGMYYFGAIAAGPAYSYMEQGRPDALASEQPGPIIPPMALSSLISSIFPLIVGGLASLAQTIIGFLSFFRNEALDSPARIASIFVLISWGAFFIGGALGFLSAYPKTAFNFLPTLGQNIMMAIVFLIPILFCNLYNAVLVFGKKTN